jgi:hypothetical protein
LPLQREQAGITRLKVFVEVTAELEGAKQGGKVVRGTVTTAVAFAGAVQACRELLAVVGFEMVKGPVAQVQSELTEQLLELAFKVVCGGRGDRLATKGSQ